MTLDDLAEFDVKTLRLQPGDVIALRYPDPLTVDQAEHLKTYAEDAFGCKVVILSGGLDLVAVREAEAL